ncbi:MAG: phosphoesterase [Saprospiraceae bacterium]|nr:MAG: phosphoesterase [Saprospiraceae bacterium]
MRIFILLLILLAFDYYVFQAFRLISDNWSSTAKIILTVVYWSLPLLAIALMIVPVANPAPGWFKQLYSLLRAIVFIAYFSKLLIAGLLFIDDLRRLTMVAVESWNGQAMVNNSRSRFLINFGLALGSIPFVSLTYGMLFNQYRFKVHNQKLAISGLPDALKGLRIVQISDIHSGSFTFREPIQKAIDRINALSPDLVFFTGDLVNNVASEMRPYVDIFKQIKSKHGVYSVLGNHDYGDYVQWPDHKTKQQNLSNLKATHQELGWDLLLNENRMVSINGEKVAVLGVENYSAHARFPKYGDLKTAYAGTEQAGLKLLLSHDPSHWKDQIIQQFKDIAITFSGHTHGMQFGVEIPGWFKWSPIQYVYKEWAGLYQQENQFLYVNRGFGFLGYPGRVGILPEITLLELQPELS